MADHRLTHHLWRTSSLSGRDDDNCVEVAPRPADVAVRDSKDRDGGTLAVPVDSWTAFVGAAKGDAFGRS